VKRTLLGVWVLAAVVLFSVPLFAHHGNAALDPSKKLVLKGVVTDWRWQNPHSILKFDVKDDSGNVVNWSAEINNPADMVERGWTARSIKIGDQVTVTVSPVKNGNPIGRIVQVVLPDGKILGTQYLKQE
jgi:Family of unknown function (DUF6152)